MIVITWNCQGAASKGFIRAAKWMIRSHNPDILCHMETKTSGTNADDVCKKLGFDKWARVEALGFSGGIWILWYDDLNIEILSSHPQFIHMAVEGKNNNKWTSMTVYGSPSLHLRKRLWNDLRQNKTKVSGPWLIAGDFNAVISNEETSNHDGGTSHRNEDFKNWIFNEGLVDLGYTGQPFTWKRGTDLSMFRGARLDRALCSMD
ncbi:PREDICTED: uncharacterized protein LOC109174053 [Ipomoea nil]|uniref:uncharacterized protein LOC109174053 n=1 Tax=Ipomoea nil TaxID=35883 RepID=UPI000900DCAF|nr:PREDICTED: uncharacterized protein LOC109174053 [Ipomoea nil]